jgi:hypothetical protein
MKVARRKIQNWKAVTEQASLDGVVGWRSASSAAVWCCEMIGFSR